MTMMPLRYKGLLVVVENEKTLMIRTKGKKTNKISEFRKIKNGD